jgi:hypothetical protein
VDGIFLDYNLLLSHASLFLMEFRLSRSLSQVLFFFSRWNSGYHEAFLTNYFFSRWNSGYHEAFLTNFSFFHDEILAITKPFSRTFLFFTMEFWLSRSLSHELLFFHDGILAITKPFSRTFLFFTMEFWKYAIWEKTLFIHISQRVFT